MRRTQRRRGGDLRRFSTHHHPVDGGSDVYARPMSLGVMKQEGASGLQRKMPAAPAPLLKASAPNRDGVAERGPDPAGQKRLAVDLALIDSSLKDIKGLL